MDLLPRISPTTISLSGEIDHSNIAVLTTAVDDALSGGATHLTVDLDEVTFMGSAVLSALVATRRRCRRDGVPMSVHCRDPRMRRLFLITGLDGVLLREHDAVPPAHHRSA